MFGLSNRSNEINSSNEGFISVCKWTESFCESSWLVVQLMERELNTYLRPVLGERSQVKGQDWQVGHEDVVSRE